MTIRHTGLCALAILGALAGAADSSAEPPPDRRALLKVHAERLDARGPANLDTVDDDLVVTFDGLLSLVSVRRDLASDTVYTTTFADGALPPGQLAALRTALTAARPRARSGICQGPPAPLGSSYRYRFTWFGQRRTSTFEVAIDAGPASACAPPVSALIAIVEDLQAALLGAPGTTISSSACSTDRQCPTGLRCCYPCGIPGCVNACAQVAANGECPAFP